MYRLTEKGREIANALDKDFNHETLFSALANWDLSPTQQMCLNWLRGNLGPKLMDGAPERGVVSKAALRSLEQLIGKGFIEKAD